MRDTIKQAMEFILHFEGGTADDPHDPGGFTDRGVTFRTFQRMAARWGSKVLDFNNDGVITRRDLLDAPAEVIERIYREDYWDRCRCDALPAGVDLIVFDCAVNQGTGRASPWLQKAVGAYPDGIIGPKTLSAAARAPVRRTIRRIAVRRALHYSSLAIFVRFGRGWLNRLFAAHGSAIDLSEGRTIGDLDT